MSNTKIKCGIIHLDKRQLEMVELHRDQLSDKVGSYGIYPEEFSKVWEEDPDAVALATGILTGCGVPGSGCMAWCRKDGSKWILEKTEGQLGATLKMAGLDHLIFTGKSCSDVNILISNDSVEFQDGIDAEDIWNRLLDMRPDRESVVAYMDHDGVREDTCFTIGSPKLSENIRKKGVQSVILTGHGAIEAACPDKLIDLIIKMSQGYAQGNFDPIVSGRKNPARYLSLNHFASNQEAVSEFPASCIGLGWETGYLGQDVEQLAAKVWAAVTGDSITKELVAEIISQAEGRMG